ncbi:hypothetical protein PCH_Pc20g14520 [Penicillium rubens Wisconsin 54-1255]|uniref:Uncharacterized protein n=1 Tax=Penicillium rubens (strain ATCC 28089 / DSM 1075 / NRRL 1951 / Wisconsin 54-1255) TaxID=500485 RepID=B6HHD6_PENRW|nr:hypothetical protein PCH_Pc20g14520 [Penicillium rubens Wisconsin 54-1255]
MRKNLGSDENNMDLGIRKDNPLLQPRSVADSHPADHEESSGYHGGDPDCRMYSVKGGGYAAKWVTIVGHQARGMYRDSNMGAPYTPGQYPVLATRRSLRIPYKLD